MFLFERIPGVMLLLLLIAPIAYMPISSAEPFKVPEEATIVMGAWVFIVVVEVWRALNGKPVLAALRRHSCGL